jgi:hypothetical protein
MTPAGVADAKGYRNSPDEIRYGAPGAAWLERLIDPSNYCPTITSCTRRFLARLASVLLGTNGRS